MALATYLTAVKSARENGSRFGTRRDGLSSRADAMGRRDMSWGAALSNRRLYATFWWVPCLFEDCNL